MNKAVYGTKIFLKKNSATILSVLGAAGVVATSVMAVKTTPKALELISEAEKEKGDKLELMESVRVAAPVYIPAALIGVGTIACIFGANALNKRTQASLISAYGLLEQSFKEYRHYADELYGEDTDKEIREAIARDKYSKLRMDLDADKHLFYDYYSSRYFQCTLGQAHKATYELNRLYNEHGYASLNDLYFLLGIERVPFGDDLGWSVEVSEMFYGYSTIEFEFDLCPMDDGFGKTVPVYLMFMPYDPTPDYLC